MNFIVTPILKLVHNYRHDGQEMTFHTTHRVQVSKGSTASPEDSGHLRHWRSDGEMKSEKKSERKEEMTEEMKDCICVCDVDNGQTQVIMVKYKLLCFTVFSHLFSALCCTLYLIDLHHYCIHQAREQQQQARERRIPEKVGQERAAGGRGEWA